MKKKFMMVFVALWGVLQGAFSYDYPYLTFQTSDGTTQSLSVESLSITFEDGQLMATNADGDESFTLTDLVKMYFSESASSLIGDVNRDGLVNITDATCLVNYLLTEDATNIDLTVADLNGDGDINITDVTALLGIILSAE